MRRYCALLTLLCCAAASLEALAAISREEALTEALRWADAARSDLITFKIEADEQNDVPAYKLEFETKFGDFDIVLARADGRLLDADVELEDDYVKSRRTGRVLSAAQARTVAAAKLAVPAQCIKLVEQGSRSQPRFDGRCSTHGREFEFELDRRSGLISSWNMDLKN